MEEKILKISAVFLTLFSIFVCASLYYFPALRVKTEALGEKIEARLLQSKEENMGMTGLEILEYNTKKAQEENEIKADEFDSQLRMELPLGVTGDELTVTNDYVTQCIEIAIPFGNEDYLYEYPMLGSSDHIDNLTYEAKEGYGLLEIILDQVYELKTGSDEKYFYLDFLTPQEVYDKVVVIDAGHGGNQPGATKQGVNEKDIDMDIVLKLKEIFESEGDSSIGVYYTRTDDSNPSLEQRVELANKSGADLFISVHSNSTKSGKMSSINGTQVLYDEAKADSEHGTKDLAQILLEEVTGILGSSNKGIVEGNEIYIIRMSEAPVALIEVGFMTNQTELNNLKSEEYQQRTAQGIYNGIMRAFAEGY